MDGSNATLHWPPAPPVTALEPNTAHVYRMSLALNQWREQRLWGYLSAEEQQRASRFVTDELRTKFIAAHGQTREILAAYCGAAPVEIDYTVNEFGKPALAAPGSNGPRLRFNLTHSGSLALLAVTLEREIGVDLEDMSKPVDYRSICRQFFAPGEVERLLALPTEQQQMAFFLCWTRKEAYIKARGGGLSIPLDQFEVSLSPTLPARMLYPAHGWQLHEIKAGFGYVAALVVEGEIETLQCKEWISE